MTRDRIAEHDRNIAIVCVREIRTAYTDVRRYAGIAESFLNRVKAGYLYAQFASERPETEARSLWVCALARVNGARSLVGEVVLRTSKRSKLRVEAADALKKAEEQLHRCAGFATEAETLAREKLRERGEL